MSDRWPETESNCRHRDFQSLALPTELSGQSKETPIKAIGEQRVKKKLLWLVYNQQVYHFLPRKEIYSFRLVKIHATENQ